MAPKPKSNSKQIKTNTSDKDITIQPKVGRPRLARNSISVRSSNSSIRSISPSSLSSPVANTRRASNRLRGSHCSDIINVENSPEIERQTENSPTKIINDEQCEKSYKNLDENTEKNFSSEIQTESQLKESNKNLNNILENGKNIRIVINSLRKSPDTTSNGEKMAPEMSSKRFVISEGDGDNLIPAKRSKLSANKMKQIISKRTMNETNEIETANPFEKKSVDADDIFNIDSDDPFDEDVHEEIGNVEHEIGTKQKNSIDEDDELDYSECDDEDVTRLNSPNIENGSNNESKMNTTFQVEQQTDECDNDDDNEDDDHISLFDDVENDPFLADADNDDQPKKQMDLPRWKKLSIEAEAKKKKQLPNTISGVKASNNFQIFQQRQQQNQSQTQKEIPSTPSMRDPRGIAKTILAEHQKQQQLQQLFLEKQNQQESFSLDEHTEPSTSSAIQPSKFNPPRKSIKDRLGKRANKSIPSLLDLKLADPNKVPNNRATYSMTLPLPRADPSVGTIVKSVGPGAGPIVKNVGPSAGPIFKSVEPSAGPSTEQAEPRAGPSAEQAEPSAGSGAEWAIEFESQTRNVELNAPISISRPLNLYKNLNADLLLPSFSQSPEQYRPVFDYLFNKICRRSLHDSCPINPHQCKLKHQLPDIYEFNCKLNKLLVDDVYNMYNAIIVRAPKLFDKYFESLAQFFAKNQHEDAIKEMVNDSSEKMQTKFYSSLVSAFMLLGNSYPKALAKFIDSLKYRSIKSSYAIVQMILDKRNDKIKPFCTVLDKIADQPGYRYSSEHVHRMLDIYFENSIDELAKVIQKLIADKHLYMQMNKNAMEKFAQKTIK